MLKEIDVDSILINWFAQFTWLMRLQELWSVDLDVAF